MSTMEVALNKTYTVPYMKLKHIETSVTQGMLAKLPNFNCMCIVPGFGIVAGKANGEVVYWNPLDPEIQSVAVTERFQLIGSHKGPVLCMIYHPMHKLIITGSADRTVKIWDPSLPTESKLMQTIVAHEHSVTALAYHRDLFITGSVDKTVKTWKPKRGRDELGLPPWFGHFQTLGGFQGWISSIWAAADVLSGANGELFVGDMTGVLTVYRSVIFEYGETYSEARMKFLRHGPRNCPLGITNIQMIQNFNMVVTLCNDYKARILETSSLTTLATITNARDVPYSGVTWNAIDEELILCDKTGSVEIYQYSTNRIAKRFDTNNYPTQVLYLQDKQQIMVSGRFSIQLYDVVRTMPVKEYKGHTGPVIGMYLKETPQGTMLISAGQDSKICVWDVMRTDMTCVESFEDKISDIYSFLYIEDERLIATGHENGDICLWTPDGEKTWRIPRGHTNTVSCLAVSDTCLDRKSNKLVEGRTTLLTGGFDGQLVLWDVTPCRKKRNPPIRIHKLYDGRAHGDSEILCLLYNKFNKTYISGGNDGLLKIWTVGALEVVAELGKGYHRPGQGITCLAVDANFIFSGSEDHTIQIWNGHNFTHLRTLAGHTFDVTGLYLVPSTGHLISCGRDGSVYVWDYAKTQILNMNKYNDECCSVTYSKANKEILCGTQSGSIVRISLKSEEELIAERKLFESQNAGSAAPTARSGRSIFNSGAEDNDDGAGADSLLALAGTSGSTMDEDDPVYQHIIKSMANGVDLSGILRDIVHDKI